MEIKTTKEIKRLIYSGSPETITKEKALKFENKKWVAVEDINTWLDGYFLKNNEIVKELTRHLKNAIRK